MKTFTATAFVAASMVCSAMGAKPFKAFAGQYKPLLTTQFSLYDPDNGIFSDTARYARVYDSVVFNVSESGNVHGKAIVYFTDMWGNKTSDPVNVSFKGNLKNLRKVPYYEAKTATFVAKGNDGSKISGQAVYEKSTFGLNTKRNLVFEVKKGDFSGSALLVFTKK